MARGRGSGQRVLQTVLFTDIVKSTERLTEVGDAGWRTLVQRHHTLVRAEIRRHRGREVDNAGDGFLVAFDQPLDAVLCAIAIVRGVRRIGIDVRAGVHTGEVERIGGKIGGISVHTAARIMALAQPGEILVSSTVQDLIAGSGTAFVDRGTHELRGVAAERRLFGVVVPEDASTPTASAEPEAPSRARPRWLPAAAAAGVLGLFVVGVAAGFVFLGGRPQALPTGPDTVIGLARASGVQTGGAHVGRGPASIAAAGNTLWIANTEGATVSRVDATTGNQLAIGNVGSRPGPIAADAGSVWVADAFADRVIQIEPASGTTAGSVSGARGAGVAIAFGSVWLADDVGDVVVRMDPATMTAVAEIPMAAASGPTALAEGLDRLWVGLRRSGQVAAIDPDTDQLTGADVPMADVAALAAAGDAVWAISPGEDALARIDTAAMRVADTVTVCDSPVALAVADDGVWVACSIARRLLHVSLAGERIAEYVLNGLPTAVAIVGDRVWVTLRGE